MIIQAVNSYNYIPSKNLSINKVYNGNQLLYGFVRYKLQTPTAGITELVTWIERTIRDISLTMDASMVGAGQPEAFVDMTKTNIALFYFRKDGGL